MNSFLPAASVTVMLLVAGPARSEIFEHGDEYPRVVVACKKWLSACNPGAEAQKSIAEIKEFRANCRQAMDAIKANAEKLRKRSCMGGRTLSRPSRITVLTNPPAMSHTNEVAEEITQDAAGMLFQTAK